ncbi:hypothetical protein BGX27_000546 [Mortierella sp. AM989]|nr:hypothetical protein BGX27_000546 [Mortierella sp. AM989]
MSSITFKSLTNFFLAAVLMLHVILTGAQGQVWEARYGLTSASYQSKFNSLVGQGYRLKDVEGYTLNNVAYYAGIWEKSSGPAWVARHGLTNAQYQAEFNRLVNEGYRLKKVSGYTVGGADRYAAIWDKSTGPAWVARHGLDSAAHQAAFNSYVKQGYRLKQISGYAVGTSARYASIWVKASGPAWIARHGLTAAQYQTEFTKLKNEGYRPLSIDAYTVNGKNYFAAVWEKSAGPAWQARHGLTSAKFQETFNQLVVQGYKLVSVTGYGTGTASYAALWTK